ncbi:PilC/PilY family type IV pilus protein [Zoogloea sp.]|uniref:pilus assembly protein n=1 Tax=Zoogloea sp. TaxID=49181 RepID=UPI001415C192|nr:MAG: hypothetical protein F9K15_07765 [Zoogloea sp.]
MNATNTLSRHDLGQSTIRAARVLTAVALWHAAVPAVWALDIPLADAPISASQEGVPANVMMALSVEFPTAQSHANFSSGGYGVAGLPANSQTDPYFEPTRRYLGYFDPSKCYLYDSTNNYFYPSGTSTGANYTCPNQWSGSYMNWATMHVLDLFRWAMTGGTRDEDLPLDFSASNPVGSTILKKTWSSSDGGQGGATNFPDKFLAASNITKYTGLAGSGTKNLIATVFQKGLNVVFSYTSSSAITNGTMATSTIAGTYQVRVKVCSGTDTTLHEYADQYYCQKYSSEDKTKSVYKPVGLIQQNINRMRFGAASYQNLNNSTYGSDAVLQTWEGGVLRAQLRDTKLEILETGAFPKDPFPADKEGDPDVTLTGAINYLNLFGYKAHNYKRYDNVNEMYAVALRYLLGPSGIGSVAAYRTPPSGVTAAQRIAIKDDFPMINNWIDPVLPSNQGGSCQKQFILGIGDTNNCSGSGCNSHLSGSSTPMNPAVAAERFAGDTANTWATRISGYSLPNDYIAGLAFAANTKALRSDFPDMRIKTFWVDALEFSSMASNNQYQKAAKYGAFVDGNSNGLPDNGEWNALNQFYASVQIPDAYFPASDPDRMVSGLRSAFDQINKLSGTAAGVALTGPIISDTYTSDALFQSVYDSKYWSGDLKGRKLTGIDVATGAISSTLVWSAAAKLDTLVAGTGWDTGRKIVTLAPNSSGKLVGVPFRIASLPTAQKAALGSTATEQTNILNYLRGDASNQSTLSVRKAYRYRASVLGDIVDSGPMYVGAPNAPYSDAYNPGYSAFKLAKASRTPVVFIGANDGMLHAFNAQVNGAAAGGQELFALVPNAVFQGPDGRPAESGLRALADNAYLHRYYVNATGTVKDVDFARAGVTPSASATPDWRTLLVTGLGKGGRSYVAMDVTDPASWTSESNVASKVLWEFTHEDMGFTFGRPIIVKTPKWGWVVIVAGGYNNNLGSDVNKKGKGVIYVLDPRDGSLLHRVYTTEGTATNPAGLENPNGYIPDYADMTIETLYAGDLLGNLWRMDFTSSSVSVPAPTGPIAKLTDENGVGQPITTTPLPEIAPNLSRYIFVGTGRMLHTDDRNNTQQQTFYALRDGTSSSPYSTDAAAGNPLPSGVSYPVGRNKMVAVDDLKVGAILDPDKPMGWFYDLTGVSGNYREQIFANPQVNAGIVAWVGTLMNQDKCKPAGQSTAYAVHYDSAQTAFGRLVNGAYERVPYITSSDSLVGLRLVRIGNTIRVMGTSADPAVGASIIGSQVGGVSDPRVLNWRIIGQ